jgi:hypothetical protein
MFSSKCLIVTVGEKASRVRVILIRTSYWPLSRNVFRWRLKNVMRRHP